MNRNIYDVRGNEFLLIHDPLLRNYPVIYKTKCTNCGNVNDITMDRLNLT